MEFVMDELALGHVSPYKFSFDQLLHIQLIEAMGSPY
jgi:hypothetical protein